LQIIDMPNVNLNEAVSFWRSFKNIDAIQIKTFETWAHQVPAINKIKSKEQIIPRKPCPILSTTMVICSDGRCVPCCRDYDAKIVLGDADKQNVLDIFNGIDYNNLRKQHEEGNFNNPLCCDCVEWAEALGIETKFKG